MSKQEKNTPGWSNGSQSHMSMVPSVGRFSNDQKASLHTKGSTAKFNDNDRVKTLAPLSNHGQHSPEQPTGTDIVDLRTAPGTEWKTCGFVYFYVTVHRGGAFWQ